MRATYRSFDAYKMKYELRDDIKVNEGILEYANTLIHRNADKYTNREEYATQIAKQSLCFELLKEKSGKLEMTEKEAEDLHLKAEKLADKIDNTGLNFENKAKKDELANSILKGPPENELCIS